MVISWDLIKNETQYNLSSIYIIITLLEKNQCKLKCIFKKYWFLRKIPDKTEKLDNRFFFYPMVCRTFRPYGEGGAIIYWTQLPHTLQMCCFPGCCSKFCIFVKTMHPCLNFQTVPRFWWTSLANKTLGRKEDLVYTFTQAPFPDSHSVWPRRA